MLMGTQCIKINLCDNNIKKREHNCIGANCFYPVEAKLVSIQTRLVSI